MEKNSTVKIFELPTEKHRLRYITIYKHGDIEIQFKMVTVTKSQLKI